jgi:hypothetical protein
MLVVGKHVESKGNNQIKIFVRAPAVDGFDVAYTHHKAAIGRRSLPSSTSQGIFMDISKKHDQKQQKMRRAGIEPATSRFAVTAD